MGKRRTEIAEGKHLDKKMVRRVTLRQYAEEYARVFSARKKSAKRDESSFKALLPVFGDCYLDAITPEMVHRYQTNRLDQGKKPATVNRELALLKTMFNRAIESGKAESNPVVRVKFLKENNARCRILEAEERERLRAEMDPRIRRIYDFARYTGLRQGEIFRFRWPDADLKGGFLRVGEAKSGEGRTVPLNATARGYWRASLTAWTGDLCSADHRTGRRYGASVQVSRTRSGGRVSRTTASTIHGMNSLRPWQ
jgi:site-specific recombinase XerD